MELEIKNALISVSSKEGIENLTKVLERFNVNIIATSGTAESLEKNGISVEKVENIAGSPELLGGRVKTLQPEIFSAILADRDNESHVSQLRGLDIKPVDLVVVNLYPFREGKDKKLKEKEMIELIDIGGVSLLRAAAKNYRHCTVLSSPDDYRKFIDLMKKNQGIIPEDFRKKQATKIFHLTSVYDSKIRGYFEKDTPVIEKFPEDFLLDMKKFSSLRYGENPHQNASIYRISRSEDSIIDAELISGKEMSYNNWMDVDAAAGIVGEFESPCVSIVKHAAPCGVGTGEDIYEAFKKAHKTDEISAFGGIIASNRRLNIETALDITDSFFEVVIAPGYTGEALEELKKKEKMRILKCRSKLLRKRKGLKFLSLMGGMLIQDEDIISEDEDKWRVVSKREPNAVEIESMKFLWKVVKWVKSNGIVIGKEDRTLGIGTGQPSRVDSVEIAVQKANKFGHNLDDSVLASDGFFPFRDAIEEANRAGIRAVVEPGGSIRDKEVIEAANEFGIALVFTGKRHFRH